MTPILPPDLSAETALDADTLCRTLGCELALIVTLVDEGVIEPRGLTLDLWRFDAPAQRRAWRAVRLLRDLELNPPGVALALQLLDDIARLEAQLYGGAHAER